MSSKGFIIISQSKDSLSRICRVLSFSHYENLLATKQVKDTIKNQFKIHAITHLSEEGHLDWATNANIQDWLIIPLEELIALIRDARYFPVNDNKCITVPSPVAQECHAVTAYTWMCNPSLDIYTGISDKTHAHSWLIDPRTNTLHEPTPIIRDCYYGFKVTDPYQFVFEEYENVTRLRQAEHILDRDEMTFDELVSKIESYAK